MPCRARRVRGRGLGAEGVGHLVVSCAIFLVVHTGEAGTLSATRRLMGIGFLTLSSSSTSRPGRRGLHLRLFPHRRHDWLFLPCNEAHRHCNGHRYDLAHWAKPRRIGQHLDSKTIHGCHGQPGRQHRCPRRHRPLRLSEPLWRRLLQWRAWLPRGLRLREYRGCPQLFLIVSIPAVRILAGACVDQGLADLRAEEVRNGLELVRMVRKHAGTPLDADADQVELTHLRFAEDVAAVSGKLRGRRRHRILGTAGASMLHEELRHGDFSRGSGTQRPNNLGRGSDPGSLKQF
mmetsp:Transcript_42697/g.99572  ORF Transcript_42697/g.99572 Transcript_42697/m.99572 type:complete len:290 (-) Transcript_42697:34-903(-)